MPELSILKSLILGILQGATEFLPVSSSGHLVIAQDLLGVSLEGAQMLAFDVCLHFGTLLAVAAVFWRDIIGIAVGIFRPMETSVEVGGRRLFLLLVVGTIPAVIAVFLFGDIFETLISNSTAAAAMLLVTGTFLFLTRFAKDSGTSLSTWRAVLIGVAQAFAITPGISRSGATISAALFSGIGREKAARFSFLLALPAILGAFILHIGELSALSFDLLLSVLAGTAAAAITGFFCIKWLLRIIVRGGFASFGYYCWAVGMSVIVYKIIIGGA